MTSSSGFFNYKTYPIIVDNRGSVYDTITLTFISSTNYHASGAYLGSLGYGGIYEDFSPINPNTSTPYFTILKETWEGTWATDDEVSFDVYPPSCPLWVTYILAPDSQTRKRLNNFTIQLLWESI